GREHKCIFAADRGRLERTLGVVGPAQVARRRVERVHHAVIGTDKYGTGRVIENGLGIDPAREPLLPQLGSVTSPQPLADARTPPGTGGPRRAAGQPRPRPLRAAPPAPPRVYREGRAGPGGPPPPSPPTARGPASLGSGALRTGRAVSSRQPETTTTSEPNAA